MDGLGGDPASNVMIATANEDGNSRLYTIDPTAGPRASGCRLPLLAVTRRQPQRPVVHGGGTDSVVVQGTNILISASAPTRTGRTAVFRATLNARRHVAKLHPTFADNATAVDHVTGKTVTLALTDPDSNAIVPAAAPLFGGDFVLVGQADQQLVFAHGIGTGAMSLTRLAMTYGDKPAGTDDVRWAQHAGQTLYVVDAGANTIYSVKGPFTAGEAIGSLDTAGTASAGTEIDTLNTATGALTPFIKGFGDGQGPPVRPVASRQERVAALRSRDSAQPSTGCSATSRGTSAAYAPPRSISSSAFRARRSGPVEDDDLIGVAHGRQPVGDGDRRTALGQPLELGLDRVSVCVSSELVGLVEHEHGWVAQHRAGDRHPLLLPAGEAVPALADDGVVALGQRRDQVVDPRGPGGVLDLLIGRLRAGEAEVLAHARVKQICLLRDDPDGRRQRPSDASRTSTPSIVTRPCWGSYSRATRYPSVVLPAPGLARRPPSGCPPGPRGRSPAASRRPTRGAVAEVDLFEPAPPRASRGPQLDRLLGLDDVDRQVQVLEDAIEQRQRGLEVGPDAEQRLDREQQPRLEGRERHHGPDRDRPARRTSVRRASR